MMAPRLIFFTGKGGVGKSTLSSLYALRNAGRGLQVLLLSMDPAHNLSDIFQRTLGEEPLACSDGLLVCEPDIRVWSERYIRDIEEQVRASYRYLTALNLEGYFSLLRHSPGLEEHAMSLIFRTLLERYSGTDLIVFDMPPTALTLRFLASPSISGVWIEQLVSLRKAMLERKEMITTVQLGRRVVETDKVLLRLEAEQERARSAEKLLCGTDTTFFIVRNDDTLSIREAARIQEELSKLGVSQIRTLLNKTQESHEASIGGESGIAAKFPHSPEELCGIPALERYLEHVSERFGD
jgi:arsenite/tail-anchored protein-transporting ATPase